MMIDQMREELNKQYNFLSDLRTKLTNLPDTYLVDVRHDVTERMLSIDALLTSEKLVSDVSSQTQSSVDDNAE